MFEKSWQKWAEGWVRQQSLARALPQRLILESLPPRSAAVELTNLRRIVNLWLLHAHDVPAAEAQRNAVRAAAAQVAQELLPGPTPIPGCGHMGTCTTSRSSLIIPVTRWGCWTSTNPGGPKPPLTWQTWPCTFSCACGNGA